MFITKKSTTFILALTVIFANFLFSNSLSLEDNGDSTWNVNYDSDAPIGGFQFNIDGANITNAGYEQIYYQSMTIQSADVDAGKVIMFTFASDTINSDYSINATVKYHIR